MPFEGWAAAVSSARVTAGHSAIAFSAVREMLAPDSLIEAEECPSRRLGLRGPFGLGFDRRVPDKVLIDDLGKHQRHMQASWQP